MVIASDNEPKVTLGGCDGCDVGGLVDDLEEDIDCTSLDGHSERRVC